MKKISLPAAVAGCVNKRKLFKQICLILFIITPALSSFSQQYQPNWQSLNTRGIPSWFKEAKFGIFIHWGVYAVPSYAPVVENSGDSYAEWYWYRVNEGNKYFKAFDWGHPWNAVTGTPQRDLLGDLTNAVRAEGLKMGYYYSLYEWFNPLWQTDKKRFVTEHMFPQFKDLVTKYKPSIIFSDGEWELSDTAWKSPELLAWLFNESPVAKEVVVNDRWGNNTREKNNGCTYTTSEYGSGMNANVVWEENRGIGHSYGYNRNEQLGDYKSSHDLILMLVDIVSRGGNLLLDIGPTADGRIPVIMQQRLIDIGNWLAINGEAIYETQAWNQPYQWSEGKQPQKSDKSYMAGYDVAQLVKPKQNEAHIEYFFTKKGSDLYCIVPAYTPQIRIRNLKIAATTKATVPGSNKTFTCKQSGNDCVIDLSQTKPGEIPAEMFVVKLRGVVK